MPSGISWTLAKNSIMPTLNALLDRSAQEGGEKSALVFGSRKTSFLDLRREVLELADGLSDTFQTLVYQAVTVRR